MNSQISRWLVLTSALLGATGVVSGAYHAHGLEKVLAGWYVETWQEKMATWHTAVEYQLVHAAALLALGLWPVGRSALRHWAGGLLALGVLTFSGLLYLLVLTDLKILGAIVPLGGLSMILGWLMVGAITFQRAGTTNHD